VSAERKRYQEAHEAGLGAGFAWANEAFSFTPEEYRQLRYLRPDLFDPELEAEEKRRRWIRFGQSSIGQQFRVR
jgi:hypothetical protein